MIREPVALALSLSKTSFVYLFSRARLLLLACLPRLRVAGASSMPPTITAASNFTRRAHNHNNRRTMGTRLEMEIMLIASLLLSSRRLERWRSYANSAELTAGAGCSRAKAKPSSAKSPPTCSSGGRLRSALLFRAQRLTASRDPSRCEAARGGGGRV